MPNDASTTRYRPGRDKLPDRTDWARLRTMSEEEVEAAALSDPDNLPLAPDALARGTAGIGVRTLRERLGLTQVEFSSIYRIPVATLRAWETGRLRPDAPARTLLSAIAREPDTMRRLLTPAA